MTNSDYYNYDSISQWMARGATNLTKGLFATVPLWATTSDDIVAEAFEEKEKEEDAVEDAIVVENLTESTAAVTDEEEDGHESQDEYETTKLDKQPDKIENNQSSTDLVNHSPCHVMQQRKTPQQTISIGRVGSSASTVSALSVPSVMSERSQFVRAMFEKDDGSISVFGDKPASRRGKRAKRRENNNNNNQSGSGWCNGNNNKVKPSIIAPGTKSRNKVHIVTCARQLACAGGIFTMNFQNQSKGDFVKSHEKPCPTVFCAASNSNMRTQTDSSFQSKKENPVRRELFEI